MKVKDLKKKVEFLEKNISSIDSITFKKITGQKIEIGADETFVKMQVIMQTIKELKKRIKELER